MKIVLHLQQLIINNHVRILETIYNYNKFNYYQLQIKFEISEWIKILFVAVATFVRIIKKI